MALQDGNLKYYCYGDAQAPAGAGLGRQYFPDILSAAQASGQPWTDPLFPPTDASLGQGLNLVYSDGTPQNIQWKRCKEIATTLLGLPSPTFEGTLNEFDVNQGEVGDCWFLNVMADVSLKPDCFNTLVPADNSTSSFDAGVFHFRFWCRGKWIDIVVDDWIPTLFQDGIGMTGLVFCTPSKTGGFWPSLLEKAYAKLYGTYAAIAGGDPGDAMLDFTGGYVRSYEKNDTAFDQAIRDGVVNNAIMSIGTVKPLPAGYEVPASPATGNQSGVSFEGIVEGHAYSVLDIKDLPSVSTPGKIYTLLRMRNPWGNVVVWNQDFSQADPNGAWRDVAQDVAQDLRSQTGPANSGEFWIPSSSMKGYAQTPGALSVCRWDKTFRGDGPTTLPNGSNYFIANTTITAYGDLNQGLPISAFMGKGGFYVHVKPTNPNMLPGMPMNVSADIIYSDYTKSGDNPQIPTFGLLTLWAPGYVTPTGYDFFGSLGLNDGTFTARSRRIGKQWALQAGTVLFIPWLMAPPNGPAPQAIIRILAEGDIFAL